MLVIGKEFPRGFVQSLNMTRARLLVKDKPMITETDAVALCTAFALRGASGWAKAEADKATAYAKQLFAKGEVNADTFGNVIARVAGNVSARRQKLEKMGFVQASEIDNAEKHAIQAAMEKLDAAADAALDKATQP